MATDDPKSSTQGREICGLIAELAQSIDTHVRSSVADSPLTAAQAIAVRELTAPMSLSELARRMCCAKPNASFVVDKLVTQGLFERVTSSEDRRVKMISLSPQGEKERKQLLQRLGDESPLGKLSDAEMDQLHSLLLRAASER